MKAEVKDVETARLTLKLPVDVISMIKNDAKSLGMTPSGYLSMAARMVNSSAEEQAKSASQLMAALVAQTTKALQQK